jgi:outer membrane protein
MAGFQSVGRALGAASALAVTLAAAPAQALEAGDWLVRAGAGYVSPKSDNGTVDALGLGVEVDSATQLAFNITYMATANLGVELLGALPFTHDVKVDTLGKVAEVTHLPPTLTLQYFFTPKSNIRPYFGAGINYTTFLDVETEGALAGTTLDLEDSWGYALEAGLDIDITKNMFFNVAVWYMDIDSKAKSSAAGDFTVDIDPWVAFVGLGWRF